MRKIIAEAVGTFCVVFMGTGAMVVDTAHHSITHVGVSLTFGLVVMAMICALGDVSGAHLNPAVSIGFTIAGKMRGRDLAPYLLGQCAGAFLASALVLALFGFHASLGATLPRGSAWQSFWLEAILTCVLMYVALCFASDRNATKIAAAIAIGGVIALEALMAGPISGASMNPARSLAPAVVSGNLSRLWIYLTAPILGAACAVPIWRITHADRITS